MPGPTLEPRSEAQREDDLTQRLSTTAQESKENDEIPAILAQTFVPIEDSLKDIHDGIMSSTVAGSTFLTGAEDTCVKAQERLRSRDSTDVFFSGNPGDIVGFDSNNESRMISNEAENENPGIKTIETPVKCHESKVLEMNNSLAIGEQGLFSPGNHACDLKNEGDDGLRSTLPVQSGNDGDEPGRPPEQSPDVELEA
jgi:hypothetical protein